MVKVSMGRLKNMSFFGQKLSTQPT